MRSLRLSRDGHRLACLTGRVNAAMSRLNRRMGGKPPKVSLRWLPLGPPGQSPGAPPGETPGGTPYTPLCTSCGERSYAQALQSRVDYLEKVRADQAEELSRVKKGFQEIISETKERFEKELQRTADKARREVKTSSRAALALKEQLAQKDQEVKDLLQANRDALAAARAKHERTLARIGPLQKEADELRLLLKQNAEEQEKLLRSKTEEASSLERQVTCLQRELKDETSLSELKGAIRVPLTETFERTLAQFKKVAATHDFILTIKSNTVALREYKLLFEHFAALVEDHRKLFVRVKAKLDPPENPVGETVPVLPKVVSAFPTKWGGPPPNRLPKKLRKEAKAKP